MEYFIVGLIVVVLIFFIIYGSLENYAQKCVKKNQRRIAKGLMDPIIMEEWNSRNQPRVTQTSTQGLVFTRHGTEIDVSHMQELTPELHDRMLFDREAEAKNMQAKGEHLSSAHKSALDTIRKRKETGATWEKDGELNGKGGL